MAFFEFMNVEMNLREAEEYVDNNLEELEEIYKANEPPKGRKGFIWRVLWSRPKKITPMSFFFGLKLEELVEDLTKKSKEQRKSIKNISKANTELESELEQYRERGSTLENIPKEAFLEDIATLVVQLQRYQAVDIEKLNYKRYQNTGNDVD